MRTFSVDELKREGQGAGKDAFLARHPAPFLVLDVIGAEDEGIFATVGGATRAPKAVIKEGQPPNPRARAAIVEKRKGANEFANMITVGRAGNNDIALEVSSVSKFHAYFTKDTQDGHWYLHDAGSSNGTWVDGEKLVSAQGRARLRDGAAVQLGPDTRARFFQATALYELLVPQPRK
ncbi:MAG TPA: FHA domain-containing protein [Planctomycetota bacterium]|nr:FHA domain-containing protein [Planctomycetota bacterium]